MVGNQVTIEVDAVRALTAATRHDLTDGAPVGQFARSVVGGGILLRHRAATAELGNAAARLRERLDALRTLVGQLADAVDASATAMDTTDSANARKLDQLVPAQAGATQANRGWTSRLHPDEERTSGEPASAAPRTPSAIGDTRGNSDGH